MARSTRLSSIAGGEWTDYIPGSSVALGCLPPDVMTVWWRGTKLVPAPGKRVEVLMKARSCPNDVGRTAPKQVLYHRVIGSVI